MNMDKVKGRLERLDAIESAPGRRRDIYDYPDAEIEELADIAARWDSLTPEDQAREAPRLEALAAALAADKEMRRCAQATAGRVSP